MIYVSEHESGVKVASLISLGVQLVGLASASILHSIYQVWGGEEQQR